MNNWWENKTDADIEWLKNNRIPNRLLTVDEKLKFNGVPEGCLVYSNNSDVFAPDCCAAELEKVVCRLRWDWNLRVKSSKYVDVKPCKENGMWWIRLPDDGEECIDVLPRYADWLLTRYEWVDDGVRYQWDERRGNTACHVPPNDRVEGIEYLIPTMENDIPPQPILVRFLKEVPNE